MFHPVGVPEVMKDQENVTHGVQRDGQIDEALATRWGELTAGQVKASDDFSSLQSSFLQRTCSTSWVYGVGCAHPGPCRKGGKSSQVSETECDPDLEQVG